MSSRSASAAVASTLALSAFLVVAMSLKTGMMLVPGAQDHLAVAMQLTQNPRGTHFYTSYLPLAVFRILGGHSINGYFAYSLGISLVFVMLLSASVIRLQESAPWPRVGQGWKSLAVITLPVMMVPLYWVGLDGGTLLLMTLVMTFWSHWIGLLFAGLLAWQHAEQAICGLAILVGTLLVHRRWADARVALRHLAAALTGRVLLTVYLDSVGVTVSTDRVQLALGMKGSLLGMWLEGVPMILWSLFGAGWLLLISQAHRTWPVIAATAPAMAILILAADHTRVGTIILYPALAYWVLFNREFWAHLRPAAVVASLVLYAVAPTVFVFSGVPCQSLARITVEQVRAHGLNVSSWDSAYWTLRRVCSRPEDGRQTSGAETPAR